MHHTGTWKAVPKCHQVLTLNRAFHSKWSPTTLQRLGFTADKWHLQVDHGGEGKVLGAVQPCQLLPWGDQLLQMLGNSILISPDCTDHQTLLVFAETSYELSTWAFWGSSDSHNTIIRPEMLSGNRKSCSVLCARCPHHCPDRTLLLKLLPQTFHSSSTQLPRSWVNPKHICQGERFKTKHCQEPKHLERRSLAPHNPVQAREIPAWSHIPNPGITQPGNTTDTPCTSLECHRAFMFCGTKQVNPSWDYFAFPSFQVFQLPQQFQGRQQYLPAKTKINFTFFLS